MGCNLFRATSYAVKEVVGKRREGKRAKLKNASTKCEKIRRGSEH